MTKQTLSLQAVIPEALYGERIDKVLAILFPDYSRERLNAWLKSEQITVDGAYLKSKTKVKGGETININAMIVDETTLSPEDIPLNIIHEDDDLLIVNKPAGLVVHPGAGHHEHTLVNALLHHDSKLSTLPRAGLIHRIDKDTTGLLLIAKRLESYNQLVQAMQSKAIKRQYYALVNGKIISGDTIDKPIARDPRHRTKMAIQENGKHAITHYRVLKSYAHHTLLDVTLETGRTHQIRVHMTSINHSLVGDKTYAARTKRPKGASDILVKALQQFGRQALHAYQLALSHPITHETMSFLAPMPDDFNSLLTLLDDHDQCYSTDHT